MRHFFFNARWGQSEFGRSILRGIAEPIQEKSQCLFGDKHSCYTYEDLVSNELGREFGAGLNKDASLSKQFESFASNYNPESFPTGLWATMPQKENIGVSPPSWKQKFDSSGKALPGGRAVGNGGWMTPEGTVYLGNGGNYGSFRCYASSCSMKSGGRSR